MSRYHIIPHAKGWAVRRSGSQRASRVFASKAHASDWVEARGGKSITFGTDGRAKSLSRELVMEISEKNKSALARLAKR
ncbi:DUF2188 domain-containing protein [Yoonia sp. R2331]|uniref:DUF2188 domain-containing protein n=1 Tax=Yoonia sp. R2331 TaxID=3237238 RepID=UPI0034E51A20